MPCSASAIDLLWGEFGDNGWELVAGDGMGSTTLSDEGRVPYNIAYDPVGGQVYWTQRDFAGSIRRSNLDGTGAETILLTGLPSGLSVDGVGGTVYWSAQSENRILRANLDGNNVTEIFSGTILPSEVYADPAGDRLFFVNSDGSQTQQGAYSIEQVSLTGQDHAVLLDGLIQVTGFAVDLDNGWMYWADVGVNGFDDTSIRRANLDGTGEVALLTGLSDVIIELDRGPAAERLYWTSRDTGQILSATVSGQDVRVEVDGLDRPHGLGVVPEPASAAMFVVSTLVLARRRR